MAEKKTAREAEQLHGGTHRDLELLLRDLDLLQRDHLRDEDLPLGLRRGVHVERDGLLPPAPLAALPRRARRARGRLLELDTVALRARLGALGALQLRRQRCQRAAPTTTATSPSDLR